MSDLQHNDPRPCLRCTSPFHGTGAHEKLERASVEYESLGIGLRPFGGSITARSPLTPVLAPPDHLRIVRFCTLAGGLILETVGTLRLWRGDVLGGSTFMLSLDKPNGTTMHSEADLQHIFESFTKPGLTVTAEIG